MTASNPLFRTENNFSQMGMFLENVDNITIPKSWLVAKGFEEINHEQIPKDSPTCSMEFL